MVSIRKFLIGLGIIPNPAGHVADTKGELEVITADSRLFYHDGTSAQPVLTATNTVTVSNKSIDGGSNTFTNLPGSAVTGTVAIANGGTGQTTQQAAIDALTGTQSSGKVLRSDGTHATLSTIQVGDVPTLNQNTTGTAANITASSNSTLTTLSALSLPGSQVTGNISGNAANVTSTVAIANGGTGQITQQAALDSLAGAVTSGLVLRGNGTHVTLSAIQAGDVPTLNQNTTGTAANVTGTVAIANGGTGQTSASAAFNALSPMTTGGDIIYGAASGAGTRLANGTSGQVLTSAGGTSPPTWTTISSGVGVQEVTVEGGNGNGSAAHTIRFQNIRKNVGTAISYADNATNGGQFTINTTGIYAMSFNYAVSGGVASIGIAVNDSVLSTNPQSMTYAQGIRAINGPGSVNSGRQQVCWTGNLNSGDIVTFKDDNGSSLNTDEVSATIVRVG